jgi:ABC-2 type transport system ATP-binding protein
MSAELPVSLVGDSYAVRTRALTKRYGQQSALVDVNVQVPAGAFCVLVGHNGAGKSTLLRVLIDLTRATSGVAEVFGLDVQSHGPAIRANIGYVPERNEWAYGWMPVGRALAHHAAYFPTWDTQYAERLSRAFGVRPEQRLGTLSKGQARRVHLLMALAHRPGLLLLDEPTDGLDPVMRDETLGMLSAHLADCETTVVLSTHHVTEVERLADHVCALRNGELRLQASLQTLHDNLHRYRAHVPSAWLDNLEFDGVVLKRSAPGREIEWTVWGQEAAVVTELARVGATVNQVRPLTLDEATLVLLAS